MSNRSKATGSKFELDCLRYLRALGLDAERLVLAGAKDEGDIAIRRGGLVQILQLKATKEISLAVLADARVQAEQFAKARGLDYLPEHFVLHKRRNHGIAQAYLTQTLGQWADVTDSRGE